MNYVLLLGAGFSRNWGGWLASEAFEYLLGCPHLDAGLKELLWRHKRAGGFEAGLAELQEIHFRSNRTTPEPSLTKLQNAILQMFKDMDKAFSQVQFEFQNYMEYLVRSFLVRFDAIFTLNQDLLLERHYLDGNVALGSYRSWDGWHIPGMKPVTSDLSGLQNRNLGRWEPDPPNFNVSPRLQPFFKLHGSNNWIDSNSQELLVLGGNKVSIIEQFPILKWSHDQFKEYLSRPDTRLMVIGYSFGDNHINTAIRNAVASRNLHIFVIDPLGVDVIDKNRDATIYAPDELASVLWPHLIGSSRRSLRETFGADRVEHSKVMRFFS